MVDSRVVEMVVMVNRRVDKIVVVVDEKEEMVVVVAQRDRTSKRRNYASFDLNNIGLNMS